MKKVLFLSFFCFTLLSSSTIDDKIVNFIGQSEYNKNKNIINVLFSDRAKFFTGGQLNSVAVLEELKINGLLNLNFANPTDFVLEFETNQIATSDLYIINTVLSTMGYQYYFIQNMEKQIQNNTLKITVSINTEYMIDPVILSNQLKRHQVKVVDITSKSDTIWSYKLDMTNTQLFDAIKVSTNEKISLPKPLKPYMLNIVDSGNELQITSNRLDKWFPYIVFYDDKLNPLYIISKDTSFSGIKSAIPQGTKYIQVGDLYNLVNIKRGLTLLIKG